MLEVILAISFKTLSNFINHINDTSIDSEFLMALPDNKVSSCCNEKQAQQLLFESSQRTVPQIFINEQPIGGFTEQSQLVANNKFDCANYFTKTWQA